MPGQILCGERQGPGLKSKNLVIWFVVLNFLEEHDGFLIFIIVSKMLNNTRKIPVPRSINVTDISGLTLHQKSTKNKVINFAYNKNCAQNADALGTIG